MANSDFSGTPGLALTGYDENWVSCVVSGHDGADDLNLDGTGKLGTVAGKSSDAVRTDGDQTSKSRILISAGSFYDPVYYVAKVACRRTTTTLGYDAEPSSSTSLPANIDRVIVRRNGVTMQTLTITSINSVTTAMDVQISVVNTVDVQVIINGQIVTSTGSGANDHSGAAVLTGGHPGLSIVSVLGVLFGASTVAFSAVASFTGSMFNFDSGYSGSGTFFDGQSVTITKSGGGFGTKPKGAKPWLYFPYSANLNPDTTFSRGTAANIASDSNGNSFTSAEHPTNSTGALRILMNDQNNSRGYGFTSPTMEVYMFVHRKFGWDTLHDGIATNHKMMRCRATINSGVPNTYLGHSNNPDMDLNSDMNSGGVYHVTGIGGEFVTGYTSAIWPDSITTNWHTMEGVFRSSTAPNVANAQIIGWLNGARVFYYPETVIPGIRDTAGFITNDDAAFVGWAYIYVSQISNNLEPTNYFYYGPTLVEDSLCRLIVSDESTWTTTMNTAHVRDFQLPTAWADGSITLTIRQGIHASLSGKYLYVVKSDGSTALRVGQFA